MKAIISSTYDNNYLFFLPFVTWSWNKLGVDVICFMPLAPELNRIQLPDEHVAIFHDDQRLRLLLEVIHKQGLNLKIENYYSPEDKKATYAQCSRLYAAALDLPDNEILITSDVDMAVFNKDYFNQANNGMINIFGHDLVPHYQYPMCYLAMPIKIWREVMWITPGISPQQYLDALLGPIECEHFRANQWALDQDTAYKCIERSSHAVMIHSRAKHPYAFATRRADRDGWPDSPPPDIIDAHLPRPGYTDENFAKILKLFQDIYPEENFDWMVEYRNEYIKLL